MDFDAADCIFVVGIVAYGEDGLVDCLVCGRGGRGGVVEVGDSVRGRLRGGWGGRGGGWGDGVVVERAEAVVDS